MDSPAEPAPAKKRCVARKNDDYTRLIECVREFRLPRQYPSTMKQAMQMQGGVAESPPNPPPSIPSTRVPKTESVTVVVPAAGPPLPPKLLRKLRILSPKGKDLGEFNVELRTDDTSRGETITIKRSSIFKPVRKLVTIGGELLTRTSCSPQQEVTLQSRTFPRILKQGSARIPRNNTTDVVKSCGRSDSEASEIDAPRPIVSTAPPPSPYVNKVIGNHRDTETRNKEACNSEIANVEITVSTSETKPKRSSYQIIDSSNQKYIVRNGMSDANSRIKIPRIKIIKDNEITSAAKVSLHKEIIESPFPIVNLNKLAIDSSESNNAPKSEEYFENTVSTQENNTAVSSAGEENVINVHRGKVLRDTKYENTKSKHVPKKGPGNDCPAVAVDSPAHCIPESQQITSTIDTIMQLDLQNKDTSRSGLSDQWNIIKKAMDSVKDNKLRALALKALADCGIGIERHVPIRLPEEHKAVHDTQIQTMVFGLLDPKSFILINKDLDSIQRLNQMTLYDMPNQDQSLTSDLPSNDSLFKAPLAIEQESDFDIDGFIKEIFDENSDAVKMQETLSVTKMRCKNLMKHLERDFESVKHYDQNGMLNIHNAVVSNNIHLVQRQLMILEQCKESVDILTEDGATSLELAIKYDARSEIVKLLLKAGAQPVISRYIHESALMIASKRSSPLLPLLIDQVSDSKLLDQIDSEGFAALHYCSMRDNLQGVKALLSAGATIDLKDMRSGRTPLFHALDNNHTAVAQALLKAGAVANVTNYAGQMPLPVVPEKSVFQNIS